MRGRLINPFLAEIARLDTEATAFDPDAGGSLESGYDDDFREPVQIPDTTQAGTDARLEKALIQLPCQIEDNFFEQLRMLTAGNAAQSRLILTFHYKDLEALGLVNTVDGSNEVKINARLVAFYQIDTGALIQRIPEKPGLYAEQAVPASHGLGRSRNLLLVTFVQRDRGEVAGG